MLLELAIGDACGAGCEYAEPEIVRTENTLLAYRQHPLHDLADTAKQQWLDAGYSPNDRVSKVPRPLGQRQPDRFKGSRPC